MVKVNLIHQLHRRIEEKMRKPIKKQIMLEQKLIENSKNEKN